MTELALAALAILALATSCAIAWCLPGPKSRPPRRLR